MTVFIGRVGACGGRTAVNRGAARRVGDNHVLAEKLCNDLYVRRFAAARARARELEQGRCKLAALNGVFLEFGRVNFGQIHSVFPVFIFALFKRFRKRYHLDCSAVFYGADRRANAATHTVERGNLHLVLVTGKTDCRL